MKTPSSSLICTLGTEAQVVTLALEALVRDGARVDEVVVVHTAGGDGRITEAIERLDGAFARETPMGSTPFGALKQQCG